MSILVAQDDHGYVQLRHGRWAATEPGRATFTMTADEWEDLLFRAASYELERRKLPRTLPLEDVLADRLVLRGAALNPPAGGAD